jgi:hypothetical protein
MTKKHKFSILCGFILVIVSFLLMCLMMYFDKDDNDLSDIARPMCMICFCFGITLIVSMFVDMTGLFENVNLGIKIGGPCAIGVFLLFFMSYYKEFPKFFIDDFDDLLEKEWNQHDKRENVINALKNWWNEGTLDEKIVKFFFEETQIKSLLDIGWKKNQGKEENLIIFENEIKNWWNQKSNSYSKKQYVLLENNFDSILDSSLKIASCTDWIKILKKGYQLRDIQAGIKFSLEVSFESKTEITDPFVIRVNCKNSAPGSNGRLLSYYYDRGMVQPYANIQIGTITRRAKLSFVVHEPKQKDISKEFYQQITMPKNCLADIIQQDENLRKTDIDRIGKYDCILTVWIRNDDPEFISNVEY